MPRDLIKITASNTAVFICNFGKLKTSKTVRILNYKHWVSYYREKVQNSEIKGRRAWSTLISSAWLIPETQGYDFLIIK